MNHARFTVASRRRVAAVLAVFGAATGCVSTAQPHAAADQNLVVGFGNASVAGAPAGVRVESIATADTGYWTTTVTGSIHAFGGAPEIPSVAMPPNSWVFVSDTARIPVDGADGLWVLRTDGGVIATGNAPPAAGTWGTSNDQATGLAPHFDSTGAADGGWVSYRDGTVRAFGAAPTLGNAGTRSAPAIDIAATASGQGLWVLYEDGSIATLGDAPFLGDVPGRPSRAISAVPGGYWLLHQDGGISPSPGATYFGDSYRGIGFLSAVDIALSPDGAGAVLAATFIPPPPRPKPPVPDGGDGRRIVYSNSQQRVWIVEEDGTIVLNVPVSGKAGVPNPGTYRVYMKNVNGWSGSLRLPWFTSFAYGRTAEIGFHGIPLRPNGTPIQSDAQLGTPLSHGCVRMNQQDVKVLYDWARLGDRVVVLA